MVLNKLQFKYPGFIKPAFTASQKLTVENF